MKKLVFILLLAEGALIAGCFKPDNYDNIAPGRSLKLISSDQTLDADGVATAVIKVQLYNASPDNRKVTFKTTLGSFAGGAGDSIQVTADENLVAIATILSVKAGVAVVTASIAKITAEDMAKITFAKTYPDKIAVKVDSFSVHANYQSQILITATLSKTNGGKPSTGTVVTFDVKDNNNNSVGFFLNGQNTATTNTDGKALIMYAAGTIGYRGLLTVLAKTTGANSVDVGPATTQFYLTD